MGRLQDEMILRLVEGFDSQSLIKLGATCASCTHYATWMNYGKRYSWSTSSSPRLTIKTQRSVARRSVSRAKGASAAEIRLGHPDANPSPRAYDADLESSLPLWMGSWRSTYLQLPPHALATIQCSSVFSDVIHRPFACSNIVLRNYVTAIPPSNQIARLQKLTHDDFAKNWGETPFILTDYVQQWPVSKQWSIEGFKKHYAQVMFRAEAVDWPFSAYYSYMRNNNDESPLYLFDKKFAEKMDLQGLPDEPPAYWPPECFGEDLFHLLGSERPAYRWLSTC